MDVLEWYVMIGTRGSDPAWVMGPRALSESFADALSFDTEEAARKMVDIYENRDEGNTGYIFALLGS